jgi:dihydrofolate reductase
VPTGHVFIATSLDGFIARPDGGLDWLEAANTSGEDHGYASFMAGIDGVCMGRITFETALAFDPWPYDKPVAVLSTTWQKDDVPHHLRDAVTIVRSVADALARADNRGWLRLYVDGGTTIRAFMAVGGIQDMVITRIPILLGTGLPLFGPTVGDVPLQHTATRAFPSGLVQSRYEVIG